MTTVLSAHLAFLFDAPFQPFPAVGLHDFARKNSVKNQSTIRHLFQYLPIIASNELSTLLV